MDETPTQTTETPTPSADEALAAAAAIMETHATALERPAETPPSPEPPAPAPDDDDAAAKAGRETLRLARVQTRYLEISEDDGSISEYRVRGKLDVETMAVFLEAEDALSTGRNPATGQPLTPKERAGYYREAHARVLEVIQERNPTANVSFDPTELLAVMALLCGNLSVAQEIAGELEAAGAALRDPGATAKDGSDPTTAAAAGTDRPLASTPR